MMSLSECGYKDLAREFLSAIGNSDYFNGTVEVSDGLTQTALKVTAIIYRKQITDEGPDNGKATITDIVPVWWEMQTKAENIIIDNDFSWNEFKKYLMLHTDL